MSKTKVPRRQIKLAHLTPEVLTYDDLQSVELQVTLD